MPAKARELYTGSLFRAARRYAEASGRPWVVLSAAHGIIDPDVVVRPYDQVLELDGAELEAWARKAACEVERRRDEAQGGERVRPWPLIEILAGVRYAAPLASELVRLGFDSWQPLARLGTGQRLRWLSEHARSCAA